MHPLLYKKQFVIQNCLMQTIKALYVKKAISNIFNFEIKFY